MSNLLQDLRYAVRMILKAPFFTAVAVGTLAVGIGANTAFFSLLDAALLRPLPVERPDELALVKAKVEGNLASDFAYADYADYRDRCRSFSGLAAFVAQPLTLTAAGASERIFAQGVSGNFFALMGRQAEIGRTIGPDDDRVGAEGAVMLSHRLWQSRFGGNAAALGRQVTLDGKPFTIVGVAPVDFNGLTRGFSPDVWIPVVATAPLDIAPDALRARNMRWLGLVGRVPSAIGRERAQAELNAVARKVREEYPSPFSGNAELVLVPGAQGDTGSVEDISKVGIVLMGVVGVLLLIACANVGGLLLARASARRREIAIRQSLGAGRLRLVRQLLTESLLLSALGAAAGLLLAVWSSDLFAQLKPDYWLPLDLGMRLDGRVLAFTALVSMVSAFLFGLAPALQASRPRLTDALKSGSGADLAGPARRGWGSSLVVIQMALAMILLLGGGLFLRSLRKEQEVDLGFHPKGGLTLTVQPAKKLDEARVREFFAQLVARARALPGVRGAALVTTLNPSPFGTRMTLDASDLGLSGGGTVDIDVNWIGPKALSTLGIPVLRGREFEEADALAPATLDPVIVNEALAKLVWPGQDAVGKRFSLGGSPTSPPSLEVVGVAKNGKYRSLRETPGPYLYRQLKRFGESERTLVVRSSVDPVTLIPALRQMVRSLDPGAPVYGVRTLEEHVALLLASARMTAWLAGLFSLVALALAALGLYGLISYAVLQRTREIGVRMALGARRVDVLTLVVSQGLRLILAGIALGIATAMLLTRLIAGLLFGISPLDPITFAGIPLLLGGVALLACYLPARRAARVDPMTALRTE
jgi:predicted permease